MAGTSAVTGTATAGANSSLTGNATPTAPGAIGATGASSIGGRVVYGIISYGGFLGIGETRVLVPWSGFTYDPTQKLSTVNTTRQVLDKAPGFNPSNLPTNTSNPDWDLPIRGYWQ